MLLYYDVGSIIVPRSYSYSYCVACGAAVAIGAVAAEAAPLLIAGREFSQIIRQIRTPLLSYKPLPTDSRKQSTSLIM